MFDKIVALCKDPDSGGRMIDNIISNSLLPALSRQILGLQMQQKEVERARVTLADGAFGSLAG